MFGRDRLVPGFNAAPHSDRLFAMPSRFALPAVLLLLTLAAGCPSAPASKPLGLAYQGVTLRVTVPAGLGLVEGWEQPARDWAAETGATVDVIEADVSALTKATEGVVIVALEDVPTLVATGRVAPIPELLLTETQLDWADLLPALREQVGMRLRRPTLLPLAAPVLVCAYRQDLLDKAGLKPPANWTEYDELVRTVGTWGDGLTAVEPRHPDVLSTLFTARVAGGALEKGQLGLEFDPETMRPRISSPPFIETLEQLAALQPYLPKEVTGFRGQDCLAEMMSGRAALGLCLLGAGGPRDAAATRSPSLALGFSRLPGSNRVYDATLNQWLDLPIQELNQPTVLAAGSLVAAVYEGPKNSVEAGWSLIQKLSVLDEGQHLPAAARSPVRESQLMRADLYCPPGLAGLSASKALAAVANSLRSGAVVTELPIIHRERFRARLTAGLLETINEGRPAGDALQATVTDWERLLEDSGHDAIRQSYRQSLGFLGDLALPPLDPR
jgi:multiple sugar transport system substrate-binding protein